MVRGQQTNKKNRRIFPFLLTSQHILDNMVESYLIVTMRHDISVQNKKKRVDGTIPRASIIMAL